MAKCNDIEKNIIKYLEKVDKIIYGSQGKYGMLECVPGYYNDAWNIQLNELKELKTIILKSKELTKWKQKKK